MPQRTLYHGPLIHSLSPNQLQSLPNALLCISSEGIIEWVEPDVPENYLERTATKHGVMMSKDEVEDEVEVVRLDRGRGEFLCPGLVDTHTVSPT